MSEPAPSDAARSVQQQLADEVRVELERPQPDWLRIKEISERAVELLRTGAAPARSDRPEVEAVRARAEATLEEVRPIVAEADVLVGADNMARVFLDHAHKAFDDAVAAPTLQAALDGFRLAGESANAAQEHALGLRAQAERKLSGSKAGKLSWGARSRRSVGD